MYDMKKYLNTIEETIAKGPFQADWGSLSRYRVPEWYRNAKFGIFIHWGIYSVPGFGSEWYSRNMYIKDSAEFKHHVETYGKHEEFGYKDFIPMFTADKFDPDAWAELFVRAGARYVVPVAEHHDGFQMYESEISRWNAAEMGPGRDVLGQLKASCEKKGLQVGASSHRVEHWFFMGHGREYDSDVREPMERGDFYWPAYAFLFGTAVPDVERGQFGDVKPYFWQTDTAIALNSWGYTSSNDFRPAEDIICDLVDIVSKNGCLLLNVGPKPDGTITEEDTAVLLKIGEWLAVNGEAVYDSGVWRKYGEGPMQIVEGQFSDGIRKNFTSEDFRFTTAGGNLYAIALKCSGDGIYCIRSLGIQDASKQANFNGIIQDVEVLGCEERPEWSRDEEGLHIHSRFESKTPVTFKIKVT